MIGRVYTQVKDGYVEVCLRIRQETKRKRVLL